VSDPEPPAPDPAETFGATLTGDGLQSIGENPLPPPSRFRVSIPGFEILAELGRGGMGVVYKARQLDLGREVAIKMVLAGAHATRETLIRFQIEAEAVARLDHENIVKIYQIGAQDGFPFFTLEYLPGGTLAEKFARKPQPQQEAARTISVLASAMHRAHTQGVVHRDLKPANILLSADGIPKIADFGLAKRFQEEGHTALGATLGTPGYLSPEQARGDNNTGPATDIYALGAILYEMLTGRTPFTGSSPTDIILRVLRDEVVSPAYHRPGISRDLETICLKCLQKEPAKRYVSAADLAQDLRNFLEGRTVTARPVGPLVRSWKWTRRHPTATVLLAALAAALAASVWGGVWYAQDQRHQAEVERKLRRQALDAVDANLTQVSESRLLQVPGLQPLRRELLDTALRYYQNFINEQSGDPALRKDLAAAFFRVAGIESAIGSTGKAIDNYEKALAIQRELAAQQPADHDLRAAVASTLGRLANLRVDLGQNDVARASYEEARAIGLALVKEEPQNAHFAFETDRTTANLAILESMEGHDDRFNALVASVLDRENQSLARTPEHQNLFATVLTNLATQYKNHGRLDEAQKTLDRALGIQKKLCASAPENAEFQNRLASMIEKQADLAAEKNDAAGQLNALQEAFHLREALASANPSVIDYQSALAGGMERLAAVRRAAGQIAEADRLLLAAIHIDEQLAAANPEVFPHQTRLAAGYGIYATSLSAQNRPADSLAWYRKSLAILASLSAAHPDNALLLSDFASTNHNAAIVARATGDLVLARQFYENSARIGSQAVALSPNDESVACDADDGWIILAQFLSFLHEYPDAKIAAQQGVTLLTKWSTSSSADTLRHLARAQNNLGFTEMGLGEPGELRDALANFAAAREITVVVDRSSPGSEVTKLDLALIDLNRATALRLLDRLPEASALLDDAFARAATLPGGEKDIPVSFFTERGMLRLDQGFPKTARQDLEAALQRVTISVGDTVAAQTAATLSSALLLADVAAGNPQAALGAGPGVIGVKPGIEPLPIVALRRAEGLFTLGNAAEASGLLRPFLTSASPAQKAWLRRIAARDMRFLEAQNHPLPSGFWQFLE
jgi:eukaryotic-like serine/threonine-protein kinase